jgi:hypothetical protein
MMTVLMNNIKVILIYIRKYEQLLLVILLLYAYINRKIQRKSKKLSRNELDWKLFMYHKLTHYRLDLIYKE